jgi:hypothetical protein
MEGNDSFVLYDITDGLNKKITQTNFLKNLNINSVLSDLVTAADTDYLLVWDVDASEMKKLEVGSLDTGGSAGISTLVVNAYDTSFDDENTEVEYGNVFGIYNTIDFNTIADGSC